MLYSCTLIATVGCIKG